MQRRRELLLAQTETLPSIYRSIEWIQSSKNKTQYIDTGIIIDETLTFEIDFQSLGTNPGRYIMGQYSGANFYLYNARSSPESKIQTCFGSAWANTDVIADVNRHVFIYRFDGDYLNVLEGLSIILRVKIATMPTDTIKVAGTTMTSNVQCRTYSSKISRNGTIVQNLTPCIRKSDNKPGMYDTVTKQFFTNAGSGEFIIPA